MARPNILDRFRPVGSPGPSGPVGVPSADVEGADAELIPVFEALQPDTDAARRRVEEASEQARILLAETRRQAEADVARARLESAAVRARAAEQVSREAAAQDQELLERAQQRADRIGAAAAVKLPSLAKKIAASLVEDYLGAGEEP